MGIIATIKNKLGIKPKRKFTGIMNDSSQGMVKRPSRDYRNFMKETYLKNIIAYRSVEIVARCMMQVPWSLVQEKEDGSFEDVMDTQYANILKRPNIEDSFSFIMLKACAFLQLSGNTYFRKIGTVTGERSIKELHIMRPDKMVVDLNSNREVIGYYYMKDTPHEKYFPKNPVTGECEILHIKMFNPLDEVYGLAAVEPASKDIDTSNESSEWNMKMLQNEARFGFMYLIEGELSTEQYDQIEERIRRYQGSKGAGSTLLLASEAKIDARPYSWSPKDIDFIEGNREAARHIAMGFGVPPQLLSIPGDNTYANYHEARQSLWEETVMFFLDYLINSVNAWLFGYERKLKYIYDLDNIPALESKRETLWKRANDSSFLTINEKRALVGYEAIEGGDVILVPANLLPLSADMNTESQEEPAVEEEEEEGKSRIISLGYSEEEASEFIGIK